MWPLAESKHAELCLWTFVGTFSGSLRVLTAVHTHISFSPQGASSDFFFFFFLRIRLECRLINLPISNCNTDVTVCKTDYDTEICRSWGHRGHQMHFITVILRPVRPAVSHPLDVKTINTSQYVRVETRKWTFGFSLWENDSAGILARAWRIHILICKQEQSQNRCVASAGSCVLKTAVNL